MTVTNPTDGITLLGVKGGPAIHPGSPLPTSTLVRMGGQTALVDAGLGAAAAICRAGVPLTALDAILITHLHSDHYLELGPLLHTAWTSGLKRPVPVYGPKGLDVYWAGFCASMAFDIDLRIEDEGRPDLRGLCDIRLLDDTLDLTMGDMQVTALRNHHPPIFDSYALRFATPQHSVVLSGDTAPIEGMVEFALNADMLVHEAMLIPGVQAIADRMGYTDDRLLKHILRSHSPADEVAKIATRAGVKQLVLNHLIPSEARDASEDDWRDAVARHFRGKVHIGQDGMEIAL